MRSLLVLCSLMIASAAGASSPIAEVICAPTEQMRDRLTGRMASTLSATGLRNPEEIVEVWTDAQGAWTLVIRRTSGQSCIVAMGDAWQAQLPAKAESPLKRM